ncbi:MAG: YciI family protein [Candidatus Eremiobacteraeota bacterium]|nr:YciI family protein [Candidatus Eremiobacteraeota bacterium]
MRILSIMTIDPANASGPPSEEKMATMGAFIEEMRGKGVLIDTGGVMPDMLEMQISRNGETYSITDGPFAEAKEFVGGYALMELGSREEAIAMTRRFLDIIGNATCHLHEVSNG